MATTHTLSPLDRLPVLGICGASGAGKTTLLEKLIRDLRQKDIRVAVVKHDAVRVQVDRPGKDSDRFYQAGADVSIFARERFFRWHGREPLTPFLMRLARHYDLVLVEGHARTDVPKIWLLGTSHTTSPATAGRILTTFSRTQINEGEAHKWLKNWFIRQWAKKPLMGCILIGGQSRRMGRPKHLIKKQGQTWLELTVAKLAAFVDQVVISGQGQLPSSLLNLVRVPDAPGLAGPMAGLLGCLRFQPAAAWLTVACDLPDLQTRALAWLLEQRRPGVRGILPDLHGQGRPEPLLACYDSGCRHLIEDISWNGNLRLSHLQGLPGIITPDPPGELHPSWRNVNTPEELKQ